MKFIDSNIISYSFYQNEFQDKCQSIIRDGGLTNTLCLIEAFNIIELQTNRNMAVRAIKGILKSNLKIVDTDLNLTFETLKRAEQNPTLKFLDLVHYTTAKSHNCESIASYDKDFDKLDIPRYQP